MVSRIGRVVVWVLQIGLGVFFVVAATPKLIGTQQAVEQIAMLGFGDWLRYLIGLVELAGAIGLVIRPLSGAAAAGLAIVMALAAVADVLVLPNPPMLPFSLMILCVVVAWARWPETRGLIAWLGRLRRPS